MDIKTRLSIGVSLIMILVMCLVSTISLENYLAMEQELREELQVQFNNSQREYQMYKEDLQENLIELESKIYKQQLELQALHKEVEKERELEDVIVGFIVEDGYPPVSEEYARELAKLVIKISREYSEEYGFDNDIPKLLGIIRVESQFNPNRTSKRGAKGLMQVMDRTGKEVAEELGINNYKPYDSEQNIRIGWYYYNKNKQKYGEDKAVVIYNQGYSNLSLAVRKARDNPKSYLNKVKSFEDKYKQAN